MIVFLCEPLYFFFKFCYWFVIINICTVITCLKNKHIDSKNDRNLEYYEKDYRSCYDDFNVKSNYQLANNDVYLKRSKNKNDTDEKFRIFSKKDAFTDSKLDLTQSIPGSDSDEYSDKNRNKKESNSEGEKKRLKSCLKKSNNFNKILKSKKKVSFHTKIKIRVIESEEIPSLRMTSESESYGKKSESTAELNRLRMKKNNNPT